MMETTMLDWLTNNWSDIAIVLSAVVTIASVIVKLTPTPKDDSWLAKVLRVVGWLALNKDKSAETIGLRTKLQGARTAMSELLALVRDKPPD
jgi:hypothetical protein